MILIPVVISTFSPYYNLWIQRILGVPSFLIAFFWMYSIVAVLSKEILKHDSPNTTYYRITYLTMIASGGLIYFLDTYSIIYENQSLNQNQGLIFWITTILGLYAIWSTLYIYYFTARIISLSNIKLNSEEDSITANFFFGFWFFIIGIWHIQPKVQELLLNTKKVAISITKNKYV
jgi:hypothetical protein